MTNANRRNASMSTSSDFPMADASSSSRAIRKPAGPRRNTSSFRSDIRVPARSPSLNEDHARRRRIRDDPHVLRGHGHLLPKHPLPVLHPPCPLERGSPRSGAAHPSEAWRIERLVGVEVAGVLGADPGVEEGFGVEPGIGGESGGERQDDENNYDTRDACSHRRSTNVRTSAPNHHPEREVHLPNSDGSSGEPFIGLDSARMSPTHGGLGRSMVLQGFVCPPEGGVSARCASCLV